jgi:predicted N-acetyltransferase YhbS
VTYESEIRTLNWPEDREALLEHIRLVHGPGDYDILARWYGSMPGFDPVDSFIIDGDNGEIAAHTMLIPRSVQFGDSVLPAAEVGVVGTLDTYRGRGYATALLDQAMEAMALRGDAVSIIFGIPNFYERWGYEYAVGLHLTSYESSIETHYALEAGKWNQAHGHQRRMASWLGITNKEVTIRPFTLEDLPAVMTLYRQEASRGHYVIARDATTWQWQIDYMAAIGRHDNDSFLVAEHNHTILAYMRLVTSAPVNWFRGEDASRFSIIEFAGADADAAEALLAEAATYARDFNADRIGLFVHPQSKLMQHALARGGTQRSFTGAGFLRLNNLALTLEGMANTLQNRLESSPFVDWCIQLRITTEDSSAEIDLGREGDEPELIELEAPNTDMIRLFSGWFGIDNLAPNSHALRHHTILQALFPKGDPKVAIADLI